MAIYSKAATRLTKITGFRFREAVAATSLAGFGEGFDHISEFSALGFTPTSGYRTQAHQDALRGQGLTTTRRSSHTRGDAIDFAVPAGMSKDQAIAIFKRRYPGAKVIKSNGNAIHATFPGWGAAPDVSGSRKRYGS